MEGEFPTAIETYNLAREAFAGLAGEDNAIGSLMIGLGRAQQGIGQQHQAEQRLDAAAECFAQAEASFMQGVESGQRLAHHRLEAYGLRRLAGLYQDCYDPPRFQDARARYDQSLEIFKRRNDPRGEIRTRAERGRLLARMGEYDQAGEVFRSVLKAFETWRGTELESSAEEAVIAGWLAELTVRTTGQAGG